MNTPHSLGWILYDRSCGICNRWVPWWQRTLARIDLDIAPLQEEWVQEKLGLRADEWMKDVRLLLATGEQIVGAEVYRFVMKRLWWAYPLWLLSIMPIFRCIFDGAYRRFADNRYRLSQVCRLA